jgi:hypothetical protein
MVKITEDELRDVLDEAAQEIAHTYDNPRSWQSWMVYLLGQMEKQAVDNSAHMEAFREMLSALQDELRNRLKTGGW